MRKHQILAAGALMLCSSTLLSHTAWFVPVETGQADGHQFRVVFGGHEGELDYPAEKVKSVSAVAADESRLTVWRTTIDGATFIRLDELPAMLLMHFDNGIYTRTADGQTINQPMSKVREPVSAINALKYHKKIVSWTDVVSQAQGQPFEVVPVSARRPQAGVPMRVKVLIDGAPAMGIRVGTDETAIQSKTGADGIATFKPVSGVNRLWAGKRTEFSDNRDFTQLSIEYLMTFDAD